jgi:non-ribosomal peptide synthetase component F
MYATKYINKIFLPALEDQMRDDSGSVAPISSLTSGSSSPRNGANATVCHIFERIACEVPELVAAEDGVRRITYQELQYSSNRFAKRLIQIGIHPGEKVILITNRSLEMIVALIGIMKSGACVVPIDFKTWSYDRIETTLKTTQSKYVVCTKHVELPNQELILLEEKEFRHMLDEDKDELASFFTSRLHVPLGDDLAYMIFTSGTTAKPKGVMIPHRAIAHYVQQVSDEAPFNLNVDQSSRVLLIFSVAFDGKLVWISSLQKQRY